ncbi:MAG: hypothetical protein JWO09_3566 [Bacteroidetes bacterium]|nr:hypothetical protein [Bacteroidota bacterium]
MPLLIGAYMGAHSQNAGTVFPVYTDITPDTLINYTIVPYSDETYDINLFGDASADIQIKANGAVSSGGTAAYISVYPLNPDVLIRLGRLDSVYVPAYSLWYVTKVAKPLNAGDPIDPPGAMWDTMQYISDHSGYGGGNKNVNDWIGGDKYIGLKYQNGSTTAYGWIRVQCPTEDSCYVKDFSAMPSTVGINEQSVQEMLIYPNPVNTGFYLKNIHTNTFDLSKLKLTDMYGKDLKFTAEPMLGEIKIGLDESLPDGCYMLQYISTDRLFSQKLVKVSR